MRPGSFSSCLAAALLAAVAGTACSSAGEENTVQTPKTDGLTVERAPAAAAVPVPPTAGSGAVPGGPADGRAQAGAGDADTSAVPADLLRAARTDLDRRLADAKLAGAVRVVAAEAVTWSDGSIGCPQPGMNYTMALVPGYRVVFAVAQGEGERLYAYHAGRRGPLQYCERPSPPSGASSAV